MSVARSLELPVGVDVGQVAGAFGALAGAGSLVEPYWTGLSEVLLAVAGLAVVARWSTRPRELRSGGLALATVVAAAVGAFALPAPWDVGRGAVLGAGAALTAHLARRLRAPEGTAA